MQDGEYLGISAWFYIKYNSILLSGGLGNLAIYQITRLQTVVLTVCRTTYMYITNNGLKTV